MPRRSFRLVRLRLPVVLFPAAIFGLLAATGSGAQAPAAGPPGQVVSGRIWKSQTTGNEYRVRIEGDVLRAEWVNLPPKLVRQGAYVRTECRRAGNRWVGTTRSRLLLPCTEVTTPEGHHPSAWCSLVTRTEINSITPERITGQAQAPERLDCQACKLLDSEWKEFIWTPERRSRQ
ncbi:MAG TPA: hypothetical protein VGZ29_11415 [Terriglobia bacterium]|nr:hypothetical protein [Terriglobia bacterium]